MATEVLTYSERYRKLYNIMCACAEICGANVIKENYRMTWVTWSLIGLINAYYIFTIYTIYEGVVIRHDYTVILQSLCLAGTAIQGYAKLLSGISNSCNLRDLHAESDAVYAIYERKHQQYRSYLKRSLALMKRLVVIILLMYSITVVGIILIPLYYRLVLKQNIFVMQFVIPGIDPTTQMGYVTHQIVQVSCILFGGFGNFASDTILFVNLAQIPLFKNILKCKFDDLDEVLRNNSNGVTRKQQQPLLKDIFQWHQKYIRYSDIARNSFYWVIAVQISAATNSIICTIVCLFLGVWPAGPVYLWYSFANLYIYCGLGNLVEIANDDVTTIIYDCLWYKLSVPDQKMLLMMLRESQKAEGMTIGGVSPLSLNTALQLTKTIYTIAMILNEFLN